MESLDRNWEVEELQLPGTARYCLTRWSRHQLKATFLPTLIQRAVVSNCRIIVILDHSADWPVEASHPPETGLTLNDVALDVVLESEARSRSGAIVSTWLRTVDKRTDSPLWTQGEDGGYHCCIIRVAGWVQGEIPLRTTWIEYWDMYSRYESDST